MLCIFYVRKSGENVGCWGIELRGTECRWSYELATRIQFDFQSASIIFELLALEKRKRNIQVGPINE